MQFRGQDKHVGGHVAGLGPRNAFRGPYRDLGSLQESGDDVGDGLALAAEDWRGYSWTLPVHTALSDCYVGASKYWRKDANDA